jgi:hypothetical protein
MILVKSMEGDDFCRPMKGVIEKEVDKDGWEAWGMGTRAAQIMSSFELTSFCVVNLLRSN